MGIRLGQLQIKDIRLGTKQVVKVYNKEQQIYSNTQEPSAVSVLLQDGNIINKNDIQEQQISKDQVVGFIVKDDSYSLLVHPDQATQCYFCGAGQQCSNYEIKYDGSASAASSDFDGETNTNVLCQDLTEQYWACNVAKNSTWKDGRTGYLPALGELVFISKYIDDLNDARIKCGCEELQKVNYWSSTLNSRDDEGYVDWTYISDLHGYLDGGRVQGNYYCISVSKITQ